MKNKKINRIPKPKREKIKKVRSHSKVTGKQVFNIASLVVVGLAHLAVILAIILSFRYYAIYPSIFGSVVGIVLCLVAIIDIVYFVGFNHEDMALKIISTVLALFIFIGGTVGTIYIAKANSAVDSVLGNGGSTTVETFSGVFVTTDKKIKKLEDLASKKVGFLVESSDGLSSIGRGLLSQSKVDYIDSEYNSNAELIQALINKDVDAIVLTSGYRGMYENDENSDIKDHLGTFVDFYTFEQDVKIKTSKPKKDITKEPFNVLLIGYSRTDWGSSVGLADAIIVTTINPQTYTVSMMSIARDSFVPITCYGNQYDKINSGRSTSRACFIETVQNFIGMDIDYYMEADYEAIVYMVDALDGVYIDNPVAFELDGYYVPQGHFLANGWQALEFCRERHHMPNGDFDRQQHQKEVIIEIARKLIASGDASKGLTIMRGISEWFSTDLTFQQLSGIFNLLLNTKNYTSLDTFDLVDFQTLRVTGYGGIMYYSYSMHLPLWVYLIYQGSYDESMAHINEVMGKYPTIDQHKNFEFSARSPYVRDPFYSLEYDAKFMYQPDPMPPFWANLVGMQMVEALQWASSNGVKLSVKNILAGEPGYDASQEGFVVDQSVSYGQLISEHGSGTITVMGTGELDESKQVPNFVGKNYSEAVSWSNNYGVKRTIAYENTDDSSKVGKVLKQGPAAGTSIEACRDDGGLTIVVGVKSFDANSLKGKTEAEIRSWVSENLANGATFNIVESDVKDTNKVTNVSYNSGDLSSLFTYSTDVVITIEKYKPRYSITFKDGDSILETLTVKEGETPSPSTPKKDNYEFAGWNPGLSVASGNATYTATWSEKTDRIPVDDDEAGSSYGVSDTVTTNVESDDGALVSGSCTAVWNYARSEFVSGTKACKVYSYSAPEPEPEPQPQPEPEPEPEPGNGE